MKVNYINSREYFSHLFFRSDIPIRQVNRIVNWFSENVNSIFSNSIYHFDIVKKGRSYIIAKNGSDFYEITFFKTKCKFNHRAEIREIENPVKMQSKQKEY